jgi:hypothetical protein
MSTRYQLPFGNSSYLKDPCTMETLDSINLSLTDVLADEQVVYDFCNYYKTWITESKLHTIKALDEFPHVVFSQGTSEAFDKFYIKNNTRRFRCFRSEYMYHQLAWRNSWPNWKFIEDLDIEANDAVVISLPFSDTGNKHVSHDTLLKVCEELNVPVLVDCAYYSVSHGIDFDFSYKCITDITFGLSKIFPLAHARVGMRFTRVDDDDVLFVYNKSNYTNRIGARLGLEFLKLYDSDYIVNKYRNQQIEFCNILEVEPSQTILFGLGGEEWKAYSRGGDKNRLGLHRYLHLTTDEFKEELQRIKNGS